MERGFASIRGDQDRIMVELGAPGVSRRIDHRQLEQSHLDWLASLPPTLLYRDEIFLCHGSPKSDSAFWLERITEEGQMLSRPIAEIESEAVGVEASLILCGHSHLPRAVRLRDGRLVVNPGSVGCPGYDSQKPVFHKGQTGTPDACYAILERSSRGWSTTFRYVPYDHMPMAELAQRNGLPVWAAALATGWVE
jgi:diadenosine tetraphosphatase ApaH/serine/threonine PP2A family protein phosphatase